MLATDFDIAKDLAKVLRDKWAIMSISIIPRGRNTLSSLKDWLVLGTDMGGASYGFCRDQRYVASVAKLPDSPDSRAVITDTGVETNNKFIFGTLADKSSPHHQRLLSLGVITPLIWTIYLSRWFRGQGTRLPSMTSISQPQWNWYSDDELSYITTISHGWKQRLLGEIMRVLELFELKREKFGQRGTTVLLEYIGYCD